MSGQINRREFLELTAGGALCFAGAGLFAGRARAAEHDRLGGNGGEALSGLGDGSDPADQRAHGAYQGPEF